jgi:prepilin-type N-terminal cleavage/methylation domain-containing protein
MTHRPRAPRDRAFTLIELLVVVSIIAVLIAILIPAIGGARNSARKTSTTAVMTAVGNAITSFKTQNGRLPGYFSQSQLAHSSHVSGFSSMENALLELAGGLDPNASLSEPSVFELSITVGSSTRTARVNTLKVGATGGPGFLNLSAKGAGQQQPQSNGLAPGRAPQDQVTDASVWSAGKFQMPDVLDAWGKPIMLWARNEAAGTDPPPVFAKNNAPTNPSGADPAALFYTRANRGYLLSPVQVATSALGDTISEARKARTLAALLGDPASPNPTQDATYNPDPPNMPVPLGPKGDFVLHSAGVDGVYLNNKSNAALEFRYLPAGGAVPASWNGQSDWLTIDRTDDLVQAGS